MTAHERPLSHTRQLRLPVFSHLLDLDAINFPPPPPERVTFQDTGLGWDPASAAPVFGSYESKGYLLHVPGVTEPRFFRDADSAARAHRYLCSHLLAASYLAEFEGDLYDWRPRADVPAQHGRLLRRNYRRMHARINCGQDLRATLRAIPAQPNKASLYFETAEGHCLCPDCVRNDLASATLELRLNPEGIPTGCGGYLLITGTATHWEDEHDDALTCDNCDRIIEPVHKEHAHE